MRKSITITGVLFIILSIILGAIAAHSLEKIVSEDLIVSFEKGVKYLIYAGFGLLIMGLNADKFGFDINWAYRIITIGTLLFSGNIFVYIFHEHYPVLKSFVHIVPIGGLLMIVGWGIVLYQLFRTSK